MNLPNKLTIFRMCMPPILIACFYLPWDFWNYIAAGIFVLAYITDIIDGAYARKHNIVTDFGKLMDPIADKLLSSAALIMLAAFDMMNPVAVFIIIAREFVISGIRLVAAGKGTVIAASKTGKLKTALQCVAITWILLGNPFFGKLGVPLDVIFTWLAVTVTILSGVEYIVKNKAAISFK